MHNSGQILHRTAISGLLICDKQTAGPLSCLAQNYLRSLHFSKYRIAGDCFVILR